jgi:branched-chain amino acid transport system permease protein
MHDQTQKTGQIDWRLVIRMGGLAGIIALYTSAVGMVISFDQRSLIAGWLSLGQVLLFGAVFTGGYLLAHQMSETQSRGNQLVGGLVGGALAGLPLTAVLLLTQYINVRSIFVNISPALFELVSLGYGTAGLGLFVGATAVLGLLGAGVRTLPEGARRPLLTALIGVILVGLLSELFNQILRPLLGRQLMGRLILANALRPMTALVLFILIGGASALWTAKGETMREAVAALPATRRTQLTWGARSLGILVLLTLPMFLGLYLSEVLDNVGLFILMGLGLNIAVGLAGLLDLGYVANYAIGAYVMAILTTTGGPGGEPIMSFWAALPISVIAAMIIGFIFALPVLRMRGDYLAIATLGFGEITRILVLSDWMAPLIGGAQGILFIPKPELFGFTFVGPQQFYYIILAGCLLAIFVSWRLNNSRIGRKWMAIREDEDVAASMGINLVKTKVLAFTISAAFGGLAGGIFAAKLGTVFPQSFTLLISINVLSLILVGGMGSVIGVVFGAFVLVGLPELLREFAEYRLLLYGALLIVMMLVRPEGIWPSEARARELHGDEEEPPIDEIPGGTGLEVEIETGVRP